MDAFFAPRAIAVLGASSSPEKLGYAVARNLIEGGFPGEVHLVNPRGGFLFGRPIFTRLSEIPGEIDLAVLIVPAPATPAALRECAEKGIRAAIIPSGGFRESGAAGAALEAECLQIARQNQMRLIGPNCIGILDTHLPLDTTFLAPPPPQKGDLALLSHSGALAAAVIDWSRGQGFGFSRIVSLGNQADVTETDLLPACADDPQTRVICLYLESLGDGQKFIETARAVAARKPILALKTGRSQAGARAAASHTGALASSESAFEAAFAKAGVQRFDTLEDLFDAALALAACPLPEGGRVAILTNAGGPGVLAADALEARGLTLAELTPATQVALRNLLPPAASDHNPVDMLASASPALYAACLRLLLDDPGVDAALVILPPSPVFPTEQIAAALLPVIAESRKPVLPVVMGAGLVTETRATFRAAGLPTYAFPERAVAALGALHRRKKSLQKREEAEAPQDFPAPERLQALAAALSGEAPAEAAFRLLEEIGLPGAAPRLAKSPAEAAQLAAELGFPLVMKIASPDILHKSDIGGVLLNLNSPEDVSSGYALLLERARKNRPQARIEGVTLQRQAGEGQEVILGAVRDPQFGALMMFGSGGVEVEGLKDLAFGLAPLSREEALMLLEKTWAGKKLSGFRSIAAADKESALQALMRLSWLVYRLPQISEIEINPLRVMARGALALDVRAVLK
ncbi:MAG: acetate--CoA ligase [Anaerolineales bacterium]